MTSSASASAGEPTNARPAWAGWLAVGVVAAGLVAVVLWGQALLREGPWLFLGAPPFVGVWEPLWSWHLLAAAVLAVVLVRWWAPAAEELSWRPLLWGSGLWALVWPVLLQLSAGWESLYTVLGNRRAYLPTARSIDSPAYFLATFTERLDGYPTHVKGHPPGATLAHWLVDALGGGRGDVMTATFLVVAASAAPAALIALDRVAGRPAARRAAPFVGLAPAAVWVASSPDAMFMGVMAWSVALGAMGLAAWSRRRDRLGAGSAPAPTGSTAEAGIEAPGPHEPPAIPEGARWVPAAAGGGLLAGASLSLSYGAVLLLGPLWALAVLALRRRAWPVLIVAATGAAVVPLLFVWAGFDWFEGLAGTREAYQAGVAFERPDRYFLVSNLVVLGVAVGPATVAALAWLRHRPTWWLVGGALAGVVAADLSSMSKGEVERIWLPAVPFLVLATATFPNLRWRRGWLAAQLASAVALQLVLRSPW